MNRKRPRKRKKMMETTLRAGVYLRVSSKSSEGTAEDEKRQTTENQRLRIEEWLKFQRDIESTTWFRDEQTGRNTKRPGFQEMMKGVEEEKFNTIIGLRVDRLFRSMKDLATHAQFFKEHKTGMIIIDQGINIDPEWKNPTSQLLLNILGAIAEFEDVLISTRTKDGLERVRSENEEREKQGLPPKRIGRPPFGFAKNPDEYKTGEFVPIPEELNRAKEVIELRERQASLDEISQRTGIPKGTVNKIIKRWNFYKGYPI